MAGTESDTKSPEVNDTVSDSPDENEPNDANLEPIDVDHSPDKKCAETESPEGEYFDAEAGEHLNEVDSVNGDQDNIDDDVLSIFDPEDMDLLGGVEEDDNVAR